MACTAKGRRIQTLAAPSALDFIRCPFLGLRYASPQAFIRLRLLRLGPQPLKLCSPSV
jgi:hypothetical protein